MPYHKEIPFDGLHKAKFSGGLLADMPATPEGFGDVYWAYDDDGGDGAIYLTNADGSAWVKFVVALPGTVSVLDDLTDVDAAAPTNTYALMWNSGASKWQPQNVARAFGTGSVLIDVTGVADSYTLAYDVVNSKFVVVSRVVNFDDLADVSLATAVKGDIVVYNGSSYVKLAAAADGKVLTTDSGAADGLSYKTPFTANMILTADFEVLVDIDGNVMTI